MANKVPCGLRMEEELIERIRNAAFWIGQGMSLNKICEEGAKEFLEKLEDEHNGGVPFSHRTAELPGSPHGKKK